jgi:creatinine amidohydrolase
MVLYMEPGAVRMERAVADGRPGGKGLTRDPRNSAAAYSASGVFGDATLATWQKGEAIVEDRVRSMLEDLDALAAAPLPPGEPRSPLGQAETPGIR